MFKKMILVAVVALSPTMALAADSKPQSGDDKNKRVCRRVEDTAWRTASRKVCMTQAQWDRQAEDQRREMEQDRNRGTSNANPQ